MIRISTPQLGMVSWRENDEGRRGVVVGDVAHLPQGSEATADLGCTVDGAAITFTTIGPARFDVDGKKYHAFAFGSNALAWLSELCATSRESAGARAVLNSVAHDPTSVGAMAREQAITQADTPHGGLTGVPLQRFGLGRPRIDVNTEKRVRA